jgi:hypothetical protein
MFGTHVVLLALQRPGLRNAFTIVRPNTGAVRWGACYRRGACHRFWGGHVIVGGARHRRHYACFQRTLCAKAASKVIQLSARTPPDHVCNSEQKMKETQKYTLKSHGC